MRVLALLGSACLLSACVGRDYVPTMEADPSLTGAEGIALINVLAEAYTNSPYKDEVEGGDPRHRICIDTRPSFHEQDVYPYRRYAKNQRDKRVPQFQCIRFAEVTDHKQITRHLHADFALSDLYCDNFFRRVALHSNGRNFIRNGANDVGAAITAALGLAAAGSAVTGGVGAGFGLIDGTIRDYDTAFLVTADLPGLQEAVIKAQIEFHDKVKEDQITSYEAATSVIIRYAQLCSWTGMRGLIASKLKDPVRDPEAMSKYVDQLLSNAAKIRKSVGMPDKKAEQVESKSGKPQAESPTPNEDEGAIPPP